MANRRIIDLYDCDTIYLIGGSHEYFFFNCYVIDHYGNTIEEGQPLDLSSVSEIEWRFAPYSVIREKNVAIASKLLSRGEIVILKDSAGNFTNQIQVEIQPQDFDNLEGAFLHQLILTDGKGKEYVPYEGVVDVGRKIQRA